MFHVKHYFYYFLAILYASTFLRNIKSFCVRPYFWVFGFAYFLRFLVAFCLFGARFCDFAWVFALVFEFWACDFWANS